MCLAIPLKLDEINGNSAVGEAMRMERQIRVDCIENPRIADFVIVHAGFASERLTAEQALEDMAAAAEVEHALAEL